MKCFDVDGILNLSAMGLLGVFQQLRFKQLRFKQLRFKQLRLKQTSAKLLSVTLLNTALLMPGGIQAAEVSPAMLLQAQSMSAAEQEKLAKQFGFDRSLIKGDTGAATELALPAEPLKQAQQVEVLAPNPQRYDLVKTCLITR